MQRFAAFALVAALLGGCATHQVRFAPYQGIPAADAEALKRGEFAVGRDALFDAAATTLEHEPYLHWSIQSLDKANGFIKADASLLREVQLRVGEAGGGRSKLAVSIPRRELKAQAKVWKKRGSGFMTAYEPSEAERGEYSVFAAEAVLDEAYFRSFAYRVLHDRTQVPFELRPAGGETEAALPIDEAPTAAAPEPSAAPAEPAPAPQPQASPTAIVRPTPVAP